MDGSLQRLKDLKKEISLDVGVGVRDVGEGVGKRTFLDRKRPASWKCRRSGTEGVSSAADGDDDDDDE